MPESTVTLPTLPSSNQSIQGSTMNYYDRKPKNGSTTSSNSSLNNNNFGAKSYNHPTHSTVMQSYFTNKLSRLCLATLDPNGNCVEAHGTLRKMLLEVHWVGKNYSIMLSGLYYPCSICIFLCFVFLDFWNLVAKNLFSLKNHYIFFFLKICLFLYSIDILEKKSIFEN